MGQGIILMVPYIKLICMGQGIILMVPVTSIQKWDTGFSGGGTKL
jgi:hypothetical protein